MILKTWKYRADLSLGQFRFTLTELASSDFETWAKESFEIATKIAYRNGGRIGIPKRGLWIARWSRRLRWFLWLRC
jgi:hypothetical protein